MTGRRRVLYDERRVLALFSAMRAELADMGERHAAELAAVRRELDEVRATFDELRAVSLARSKAELEVAELRHLREIGRARAAEHDPAQPLL